MDRYSIYPTNLTTPNSDNLTIGLRLDDENTLIQSMLLFWMRFLFSRPLFFDYSEIG
jgi:hypothetical protein